MSNSTESKLSTELDTATKKNNRWFRAERHRGEIDQLFDLYWGGKERRITGLTLKIMGVNVIAVIMLIVGVVYLSQYHTTLVASKLEHFETEITLVTAVMADGAVHPVGGGELEDNGEGEIAVSKSKAGYIAARLGATLKKRILVFDKQGKMIVDSKAYIKDHGTKPIFRVIKEEEVRLESVELLKDMAGWLVSLFPQSNVLPLYPGIKSEDAEDYYDAADALHRNLSMSAWRHPDKKLVLTAAMPLLNQSRIAGVVMMVNDSDDIGEAIGDAWFNILKIFLVTLVITILLSIYLSGVIARPLRKLANAAENVRKGKLKHTNIPDMSDRNDEIGELSIVLRDMTNALWQRMDTIEAFAADVAHEIKNPLTSLKSAVETATIVKKKKDLNKLLDIIKHDIERLDRLISDISNASRLDAELSREKFDILDLKHLFKYLLDSYKTPLDRNGEIDHDNDEAMKDDVLITLDMRGANEVKVRGSEGKLIQVFQNIIANALSFSPKKSRINTLVSVADGRVTVSVEDEGPGIPENQLKNIFERFYSERPEHEKYGQHSGLGLSICKQIITAHNGVIYAENKKDIDGNITGSRFVVILNSVE